MKDARPKNSLRIVAEVAVDDQKLEKNDSRATVICSNKENDSESPIMHSFYYAEGTDAII